MKALENMEPTSPRSIFVAAVLLLMAHAISAQINAGTRPIYAIEFKPGTNTTVVKGTVGPPETRGPDRTNEGREQYTLRVRAGQRLRMEISSDNRQAEFTLIKPSPAASRNELVKDAAGVKRWSGTLTMSGDYRVTVFTLDRESVRFRLRVTLH